MKFLNKALLAGLSIFIFSPIDIGASTIADYLVNMEEQETENSEVFEEERVSNKVTRIKADLENKNEKAFMKHIQIEIVELRDNQGLKYVGGKVSKADLSVYLKQMEKLLGNDFTSYRKNQALRDHHTFHITLVNPYELQTLNKDIEFGGKFSVSLLGLGRVEKDDKTTYFVVAKSPQAQFFRQKLTLNPKDFHVTLGFKSQDVFGVSKDETSLIDHN